MPMPTFAAAAISSLGMLLATSLQQDAPAPIDPDGVPGALVIVGGGGVPEDAVTAFMDLAGGSDARIVVIPTASEYADDPKEEADYLKRWKDAGAASVTFLHTRDRARADSEEFVAPLKGATGVWFGGGDQSKIAEAYLGTKAEAEILAVRARGGVIGGTSAGAGIQSRVMIAGGNALPEIGRGLDLLPDAIVDQHFLARKRQPRLVEAVRMHPARFGLGIDEGTAAVVKGREVRIVGKSSVVVALAASSIRPARLITLNSGDVADLTTFRRAARERAKGDFPPTRMQAPAVPEGSLVIIGGGGIPDGLIERFIELAGGPDAPIVILPTANPDPLPPQSPDERIFRLAGARDVKVLDARKRADVESPEFRAAVERAKGVWFGGGRQWRFVDAYEGTQAVGLFRGVLKRGGVIGGSSAGATIQGDYLVRGNPLGNAEMMAEGYERGFAFLPGVAIDQHFTQRNRFADLAAVSKDFPQVLGIGIDEDTALVVRGDSAEVVGEGRAFFYDPLDDEPGPIEVPAGGSFRFGEHPRGR
jgi:cyanophycinase